MLSATDYIGALATVTDLLQIPFSRKQVPKAAKYAGVSYGLAALLSDLPGGFSPGSRYFKSPRRTSRA